MAKKFGMGVTYTAPSRKKRPGVHAKSKHSTHKHSVNYVKPYRGQGK